MPLSPHEAATMLGVPHTADAAAIDAAVERQRGEYDQQIARAVTPEIATYWRNQRARLDEAREVLHRAIDARRQAAEAAAAEAYERAMAGEADGDPGTASEESPSHAALRAEWERLHHAPGDQPGVDARPGLPWEAIDGPVYERARATVTRVLREPSRAFTEMRRSGGIATPLVYALFVGLPATTFATYLYFLFQVMMNPQEFGMGLREAAAVGLVVTPVYVAVVFPVSLFLNAGMQHLSLLLVEKTTQPFETTFRVTAYALGSAAALQWIPGLGLLLSAVAQIVVNIIGLARAHDIPTGRAALAYFLPLVTCCLCMAGLIMAGTWVGTTFGR